MHLSGSGDTKCSHEETKAQRKGKLTAGKLSKLYQAKNEAPIAAIKIKPLVMLELFFLNSKITAAAEKAVTKEASG